MLDIHPQLSKGLFWDVDFENIDWEKNAPFVVERVLGKGKWENFKSILEFYGKVRIKKIILNLRYIDNRTLHFCSVYFNIPLTEFRCYNIKLSNQQHWNY